MFLSMVGIEKNADGVVPGALPRGDSGRYGRCGKGAPERGNSPAMPVTVCPSGKTGCSAGDVGLTLL